VREAAQLMEAMPAVGAADLFRLLDVKIGAKLIGSMELEHGAGLLNMLLFATATMATTVTMVSLMPQRVVRTDNLLVYGLHEWLYCLPPWSASYRKGW
jgi:hypothetical protein